VQVESLYSERFQETRARYITYLKALDLPTDQPLFEKQGAQEWLERWRDNPKVLERELAGGGGS